ncbi:protein QIL1-like [Scleropages formosus]|uniref:MICOS complex subunit MIC13 n=1 Tax=Scleropages formosus TaxID=113540 RepID=A0A0N8JV88_SCLFO|nr:protein QIL1-like [Scleropages formosus]
MKLVTKVSVAGGALYVAYDTGLLGSGEKGAEVLGKAKAAIPPALQEWMKYFGVEVPAPPKIDLSPKETWNTGVQKSVSALSVAPTKVCEYTNQGIQYLKNLSK